VTAPLELRLPLELAYTRKARFAVQLLDAVTMERVSEGIEIVAEGLHSTPIVNHSGLFVWVNEDVGQLKKISIHSKSLPYEDVELTAAELQLPSTSVPLTTVELAPNVNYAFARGITGARGSLIEDRHTRVPVANAEVHLRWLDEDGVTWREAPTRSHTTSNGDFVSIARFATTQASQIDASGAVTVRLRVLRVGSTERGSADVKLPQGEVADSTSTPALTLVWDELQP
jgi:hypothetical protein